MARILQAFHSNPALGGFGNESGVKIGLANKEKVKEGDCDAFAQIVKELVDNAVDACRSSLSIKRVRVDFVNVSENILRVTVTDNGCGMACVQNCVEAFRSNKRELSNSEAFDKKTAGRYGIGLTLCLLHAQRLVPNSTASITSATAESPFFQRADYVVNTVDDCVKCIHEEKIPKNEPSESGTSVSVLVPGGPLSHRAWPRLAEYFARFQLSLGLPCSLEVMAPKLSKIPLFVRSPLENTCYLETKSSTKTSENVNEEEASDWESGSDNDSDFQPIESSGACTKERITDENIREDYRKAVSNFLKRNIDLKNVAHSTQPIGEKSKKRTKNSPTLEVGLIVYGKLNEDNEDDEITNHGNEMPSAPLTLIRMVNRIPLLDGAEASSCGLVRGLASKQRMWTSFGLSINHETQSSVENLHPFVPTYKVKDADSVASFFQRSPHQLFEEGFDEENQDVSESTKSDDDSDGNGHTVEKPRKCLALPAHLRLGNILVIIQINATPSSLPLPTLSKSRLPMNDLAIDRAMEAGVLDCLKSIQRTNPSLLLTSRQLKTTVRDKRYIPAVAAALACVLCKSHDKKFQQASAELITDWNGESTLPEEDLTKCEQDLLQVTKLGPMLEAKLRHVVEIAEKSKGNRETAVRTKTMTRANSSNKSKLATPLSTLHRQAKGPKNGTSPPSAREAASGQRGLLLSSSRSSSSFESDGMPPSPSNEKISRKRRLSPSFSLSSRSFKSEIGAKSIDAESTSDRISLGTRKGTIISTTNHDSHDEDDDDEWW
mmetsp:Transcript_13634/g.21081  ORF Transcript_13634/g.21081 Transcript_13634/m.21081 type:complete len:775 (-) Transcript_13634:393-2717(-)